MGTVHGKGSSTRQFLEHAELATICMLSILTLTLIETPLYDHASILFKRCCSIDAQLPRSSPPSDIAISSIKLAKRLTIS
jgi:hypothetical protein